MRTREASLVALLQQALDHESLAVRQYAAFALVSLGDAGRAARVRAIVKDIVAFLPDNVDHRGTLASAAALDGDPAAAWNHHAVNLRIFPMSRTVVTGAQAQALREWRAAMQRGDLETAAPWAARAVGAMDAYLAKRPKDGWGFVWRGFTKLETGDLPGAEADLAAASQAGGEDEGRARLAQAIAAAKGGGR
jgi:hypothetical protein